MTEAEWRTCDSPMRLLEYLQGKASGRKLRLCATAFCRGLWSILEDNRSHRAVELAEQFADGGVSDYQLMLARGDAEKVIRERTGPGEWAARAAAFAALPWADSAARGALGMTPPIPGIETHDTAGELRCRLIRDVCENVFRTVTIDPAWLAWNDGTVVKLAQAIYDQRELPSGYLDAGRLAIMADALEDAGCQDTDILRHCRSGAPHVLGCWIADAILAKS